MKELALLKNTFESLEEYNRDVKKLFIDGTSIIVSVLGK
jgi:hypothetical protein